MPMLTTFHRTYRLQTQTILLPLPLKVTKYDQLGTAVAQKNVTALVWQPPEKRNLHTAYHVSGFTPKICTIDHVVTYLENGKPRLVDSYQGTSPDLSVYDSVPFKGAVADVPTRHLNLAELDMFSNMTDQKVDLLATLGELMKTAEGVLDSLNLVVNAAVAAKKGKWKQCLKTLGIEHRWRASARNTGARWLEVSFGWLPLLGDMRNFIDLSNGLITRPLEFSCEGKHSRHFDTTTDHSKNGYKHRVVEKGVVGYRCSMIVRARSDLFQVAQKIGIDNPVASLYQLAPFSFLIDYVTPIGDWLTALSAPVGFHFITGSRTAFYKSTVKEEYERTSFPYGQHGVCKGQATYDVFYMNRSVYPDFPVPSLALKNPLSSLSRGANLVSLLTQTFKGNR